MSGLSYESKEIHTMEQLGLPSTLVFPNLNAARRIYFYSILDRPEPEKYEWDIHGLSPLGFIDCLKEKYDKVIVPNTIGSLIAFPHVFTDTIWGGFERETDLYQKFFETSHSFQSFEGEFTLRKFLPEEDSKLGAGIGCPSELIAYAIEALRWAGAETVPEYLLRPEGRRLLPDLDEAARGIKVKNPSKIEEFYASKEQQKEVFEDSRKQRFVYFI